jgi:hypothetical protein
MLSKVTRWFFFGVLIAVVPLAYSYENLVIKLQPASVSKITSGGELLIVVWTLCAGAIGELFGNGPKLPIPKIIAGGLCTIILVFSALLFGSIFEARVEQKPLDEQAILIASVSLFLGGVVTCTCCLALSEA